MNDDDWKLFAEPWERLRWARRHWQKAHSQNDSAADAARSLDMEPGTYRAYERAPDSKHANLTYPAARRFGRRFNVSWIWLLENEGSPFDRPSSELPEPIRRTVGFMSPLDETRQKALADAFERLLRDFIRD